MRASPRRRRPASRDRHGNPASTPGLPHRSRAASCAHAGALPGRVVRLGAACTPSLVTTPRPNVTATAANTPIHRWRILPHSSSQHRRRALAGHRGAYAHRSNRSTGRARPGPGSLTSRTYALDLARVRRTQVDRRLTPTQRRISPRFSLPPERFVSVSCNQSTVGDDPSSGERSARAAPRCVLSSFQRARGEEYE